MYSIHMNGNTTTCTSTTMMTQTASTAFVNERDGSRPFLEDPAKVALVSAVVGLAAAAALSAGMYKVMKKKCTIKPETTR